jgi:catechol 2,3-dioxygenase-like lactoylglutathione lyase family enzyme
MEVVEVVVYTRDMARATSFYRDVPRIGEHAKHPRRPP